MRVDKALSTEQTTKQEPLTADLRKEHEYFVVKVEALSEAAERIPEATAEERNRMIGECLHFLRAELLPHAQAEEETLYPDWAELVGFQGATAFLIADHLEIIALIDMLDETASSETKQLQELLYGLEALIFSHFQKEENLVFPSLDDQREDLTIELLEKFEAAERYQTTNNS